MAEPRRQLELHRRHFPDPGAERKSAWPIGPRAFGAPYPRVWDTGLLGGIPSSLQCK